MKNYDNFDNWDTLCAQELCLMIGQPFKRRRDYCIIRCYNLGAHKHDDQRPSLVVYGYERGYFCFGCNESGTNSWLLRQYNARDGRSYKVNNQQPKPVPQSKKTAVATDEYTARLMTLWMTLPELPDKARTALEAKGFAPDMYEVMGSDSLPVMPYGSAWRWHTNQVRGWGEGIFIPYMYEGKMITARLRRLDSDPRFLSMPGNTVWPYNLDAVVRNNRVFVTEGETDCLTLNFSGAPLPAVAIPGATVGTAITKLMETAQNYCTQLVVLPDNDEAGKKFAERLEQLGWDYKVSVKVVQVPFAKDVNEWYQQATHEQVQAFYEQFAPAPPPPVHEPPSSKKDNNYWWVDAAKVAEGVA